MSDKITIQDILDKKRKRQKISMLTAYTFPLAKLLDQAGIDIILVGDSVANVELGRPTTTTVTMDEMLHHVKAVRIAVKHALVIADMPYGSFHRSPKQTIENAYRFIQEASADGVKLEWHKDCKQHLDGIRKEKIPVMGHVGLTPQTAEELGGFKVQGKDPQQKQQIIENALTFEEMGCFSLVLECIPYLLAQKITGLLKIPTIGIGAGKFCDGQVLVTHDMLGLFTRFKPRFVKQYADLSSIISKAVSCYKREVEQEIFPDQKQSFK